MQLLDLNSVIHEISRMLLRMIGEDIVLVFVPSANLGIVKADSIQIEQVLMNLAGNARDAMPFGGKLTIETIAITLDEVYLQKHTIVPAGDYVLLIVTDTGLGIAPRHLPHIFEPFYTTKENEGTGLGLATVYGIVKQSGGFVWVYSEVGMGTTFKIYLPRVHSEVGQRHCLPHRRFCSQWMRDLAPRRGRGCGASVRERVSPLKRLHRVGSRRRRGCVANSSRVSRNHSPHDY